MTGFAQFLRDTKTVLLLSDASDSFFGLIRALLNVCEFLLSLLIHATLSVLTFLYVCVRWAASPAIRRRYSKPEIA